MRGVARDDINGVYDPGKTNRVKHLRCAEDGKGVGASHQYETERRESNHERETFCTAPYIQDFGHGNVCGGTHARRDDGDDGQKGVFFPFARDVGRKIAQDG